MPVTVVAVIAGVSISAGALFWYRVVLPFSRILKNAEELERGDSIAARVPGGAIPSGAETAMTNSLVNLSEALAPAPVAVRVAQPEPEESVLPAA